MLTLTLLPLLCVQFRAVILATKITISKWNIDHNPNPRFCRPVAPIFRRVDDSCPVGVTAHRLVRLFRAESDFQTRVRVPESADELCISTSEQIKRRCLSERASGHIKSVGSTDCRRVGCLSKPATCNISRTRQQAPYNASAAEPSKTATHIQLVLGNGSLHSSQRRRGLSRFHR